MFDGTRRYGMSFIIAGILVGLLVLAACAPAGEGIETEPPAEEPTEEPMEEPAEPPAAEEVEVTMINTTFQPEEITVAPGTTVTWVNEDSFAHTVTSGTRGSPTDMFDETVDGGGSFSFTFQDPGTYDYFCSIHPGMSGVVIVEE